MANRDTDLRDYQAGTQAKNPRASWKIWVKTARPFSLTASVTPILVGTALAGYDGTFHLLGFLAALCASLFLQIGANYFNEYFDYRYGLETPESLGSSTLIFPPELPPIHVLPPSLPTFSLPTTLAP